MQITFNKSEINHVANRLIPLLKHKIVVFKGQVGAGKTTLITTLCKAMGVEDDISSPTFSIVNEYVSNHGTIYHFDLYRINDLEETYDFGIEDYLYSNYFCLIEWPEIIEDILPEEITEVHLEATAENVRKLTLFV